MRTLVISDIHGCYDEFELLLQKVKYQPGQDKLILLGDYVDRGQKSRQVVERVKELHDKWGAIVLLGNHDDMMIKAVIGNNEEDDAMWLNNGGLSTIQSYCGLDFFEEHFDWHTYEEAKKYVQKYYKSHLAFLASLPLYYETDHHIFVHAGINPFATDWKKQDEQEFIWIRNVFITNKTNLEKTVVFGHTPTASIHDSSDIWFSDNGDKVGIDGACAYGRQLNCLEIHEDGYETYSVKRGEIGGD